MNTHRHLAEKRYANSIVHLNLMKRIIIVALLWLLGSNSYAQQEDTVKVLVLSPYKVVVDKACQAAYNELDKKIQANRPQLYAAMKHERDDNPQEFNAQPWYVKQMYESQLALLNQLTLANQLSFLFSDFLNYRMGKPLKIKPRLVIVTAATSPGSIAAYKKLAGTNDFIVNIPAMQVYKTMQGVIMAKATTQLYNCHTNTIVLDKETEGNTITQPYDIVRCNDGGIDCAMLNAVYPNFFECLDIIGKSAGKHIDR